MKKLPANAVLLLVDVQKGFDDPVWGSRNNPHAEKNMACLLEAWRASKRPIIHVKHLSLKPKSPLRKGTPGCSFKDEVKPQPGELVVWKHVNSAFIGTDLEATLRKEKVDTLVIVGLTTPYCVSTTTRMAGNLGFDTYVVSDAVAAFALTGPNGEKYSAEEVHAFALTELHEEFATVLDMDAILQTL